MRSFRHLLLLGLLVAPLLLRAESVVFDGQTYHLAYNAKNDDQILREYLPKGQKLERWTRLVALFDFLQTDDPKTLAVALLNEVKRQNPQASGDIMENAETGEYLVSFLSWPEDKSFLEYNVFRYSKGKKGVRAQQFATRGYRDFDAFLSTTNKEQNRYIELMATKGLELKP